MDLAPWQWIAWTNGSLGAFAGVQPAAARDDAPSPPRARSPGTDKT